ncbi:MAG TPA: TIM barrel protein [Fibrobacteria bacterium]|jgi:hydroxypyruvate isomerase|nr:TIM barrel protein [Fibrobacteria bacterium]
MGVLEGKIKPALPTWPMNLFHPEKWSLEKLCQVARQLGVEAIEVVNPEDLPMLAKYGLTCSLTVSHWFTKGYMHRAFWPEITAAYKKAIDANAAHGFTNVVAFWGYGDSTAEGGGIVTLEEAKKNLIEGYKGIVKYAEEKGCVLCLEPLNSRDPADWKGHPEYQGSNMDDCLDVIKAVGSPALKLCFDMYHVQIMNGDLIRRVRENHEYIGYAQAAGVPGRYELDEDQEINFPAVLRALAENGYRGYLGMEFIPTKADPMDSLVQAVDFFRQ